MVRSLASGPGFVIYSSAVCIFRQLSLSFSFLVLKMETFLFLAFRGGMRIRLNKKTPGSSCVRHAVRVPLMELTLSCPGPQRSGLGPSYDPQPTLRF